MVEEIQPACGACVIAAESLRATAVGMVFNTAPPDETPAEAARRLCGGYFSKVIAVDELLDAIERDKYEYPYTTKELDPWVL
jgi:hypothetical protein